MEEEIFNKGKENCKHIWRAAVTQRGNIMGFYCVRCRRVIRHKYILND